MSISIVPIQTSIGGTPVTGPRVWIEPTSELGRKKSANPAVRLIVSRGFIVHKDEAPVAINDISGHNLRYTGLDSPIILMRDTLRSATGWGKDLEMWFDHGTSPSVGVRVTIPYASRAEAEADQARVLTLWDNTVQVTLDLVAARLTEALALSRLRVQTIGLTDGLLRTLHAKAQEDTGYEARLQALQNEVKARFAADAKVEAIDLLLSQAGGKWPSEAVKEVLANLDDLIAGNPWRPPGQDLGLDLSTGANILKAKWGVE